MAIGQNGAVVRQINRLFESGTVAGLSESELLDRFVVRRDESAFEAIVVRHGPMVLGVCRRSLSDPNDVDDAFQATFLVLVKKAATLRDRARLANWLYGVARQVSIKARANALKRQRREGRIEMSADLPDRQTPEHPLKSVLDEELARLSDRDRAPIVLCDLEGLTGDEAADVLGLRPVTLRSRLHRSRMKLKDRLARRGLDYGAGAPMVAGAIPSMLAEQTVKAAVTFATGPASVGAISASVVALTQGVLKTMTFTKMKTAAAMLVALGLVGTGAGVAQDPTPVRNPKDDDRLRQVEQKLDRVLQALENRPAHPTGYPTPFGTGYPATAPPSAEPAAPSPDNKTATIEVRTVDGSPRLEARKPTPSPDMRPSNNPFDRDYGQPDSVSTKRLTTSNGLTGDRLLRLEKRIDELDQRLRRLEGGLSGNHLPEPATTPDVRTAR